MNFYLHGDSQMDADGDESVSSDSVGSDPSLSGSEGGVFVNPSIYLLSPKFFAQPHPLTRSALKKQSLKEASKSQLPRPGPQDYPEATTLHRAEDRLAVVSPHLRDSGRLPEADGLERGFNVVSDNREECRSPCLARPGDPADFRDLFKIQYRTYTHSNLDLSQSHLQR